jgi:prolipoprotein diacylglyceryltransferase
VAEGKQVSKKTENQQEEARNDNTAQFNQLGDAEDSHFYAYFMTMVVICIIGYLVFHNKQKVCNLEKIFDIFSVMAAG